MKLYKWTKIKILPCAAVGTASRWHVLCVVDTAGVCCKWQSCTKPVGTKEATEITLKVFIWLSCVHKWVTYCRTVGCSQMHTAVLCGVIRIMCECMVGYTVLLFCAAILMSMMGVTSKEQEIYIPKSKSSKNLWTSNNQNRIQTLERQRGETKHHMMERGTFWSSTVNFRQNVGPVCKYSSVQKFAVSVSSEQYEHSQTFLSILPYLPERKTTLIEDSLPDKNTCQGKMYLCKTKITPQKQK